MTVHLTLTDEQGKALNWLLGSLSAGVCDDLTLTRVYDKLYDEFGYVGVDGVVRSEFGCWQRESLATRAVLAKPEQVERYIDAT